MTNEGKTKERPKFNIQKEVRQFQQPIKSEPPTPAPKPKKSSSQSK